MSAWTAKETTKTWDSVFDRAWAGEPQFVTRDGSQTVVVIALNAYKKVCERPTPDFMRFAGTLSPEDAREMSSFVEHADFSKVDEGIATALVCGATLCSADEHFKHVVGLKLQRL